MASMIKVKTLSPEIAQANADILAFANRMVATGSVTVTSPMFPEVIEHRLAVRDHDADGFRVVFLAVVDGEPNVSTMDFDISDSRALRHIPHPDGLGLTLRDTVGRSLVEYRIS